jgi:hypothetical protein
MRLLRRPRSRRNNLRSIFIGLGVLLGVLILVAGLAGYRMLRVERDLKQARDLIESASTAIEQGRLGDAQSSLVIAEGHLIKANAQLYGRPELEIISWAPVMHQNIESLRSSVSLALHMATGGDHILRAAQPLQSTQGKLEVSLKGGTIPLTTVRAVQREVDSLARALPGQGEQPSTSLLAGPVGDLQDRVYREAGKRREQLTNVSRALALLSEMAGANGNRRYLIAVANPAEMRGAGGMVLSYGVLTSSAGKFTLGDFGGVDDLALPAPVDPAALKLPADYLARWNGLEPTLLWRNATVNPDLRFDGPVLEAMYKAKTGVAVSGVIQVDPAGLAAILTGTGPIEVPTVGTVTPENVVDLTINRAYIDFPNRDQRQEVLGDVAKIAFRTLTTGTFTSLRPFGEALFNAAAGRHLIFYPNAPGARLDVASFGADGALPSPDARDHAFLTVQNLSKNKLDYYVDTSLQIAGNRDAAQVGKLTATITVSNLVPPTVGSSYIVGPNDQGEEAGLYRAVVSLYIPNGTALDGADGATTSPPSITTEAGRTVIGYQIDVPAGMTSTVTLQLSLSPRPRGEPYSFSLVPIPRVRPTVVAVSVDSDQGPVRRDALPVERPIILVPR